MASMQPDARTLTRGHRLKAALGGASRWMLVTVVFCLALVGVLHLTRGTAVQHVRGVGADGVPVGEQMDRIFIDDLRNAEGIAAARFGQRSWVPTMAGAGRQPDHTMNMSRRGLDG
jgi:hypothetical protein